MSSASSRIRCAFTVFGMVAVTVTVPDVDVTVYDVALRARTGAERCDRPGPRRTSWAPSRR